MKANEINLTGVWMKDEPPKEFVGITKLKEKNFSQLEMFEKCLKNEEFDKIHHSVNTLFESNKLKDKLYLFK